MYKVNDVITYGTQGICKIVDVEDKVIDGAKQRFFVLKPAREKSSTIFAPTDNEHVLKKMRKLLTKEEIDALIDAMPDEKVSWISNVNERKEYYRNLLASGDHAALIRVIKSLYYRKKEREADGKRLHMMDENFFKDAERILYDEFQYVLHLNSKKELMNYIFARIETA